MITMEHAINNGLEWSQTANISYRSLAKVDQDKVIHALGSFSSDGLLEKSNRLGGNLYVINASQYLRLLFKRDVGNSLRLVDILDRRVVESFLGKHIA